MTSVAASSGSTQTRAAGHERAATAAPVIRRDPAEDPLGPQDAGQCACGGGCPDCSGDLGVQPKLLVGALDDPAERDADRIADAVIGGGLALAPSPALSGAPTVQPCGAVPSDVCPCHGGGDHVDTIARSPSHGAVGHDHALAGGGPAPPLVAGVVGSGRGSALDPAIRATLETRFGGADFGPVRVHTDDRAAASAAAIGARAYTLGSDVVFGARQYAPASSGGLHTLAHELAHVVQQGRGFTPSVQRQRGHPSGGGTSFHCRTPSDHRHRPAHDWATRQVAWSRHCDTRLTRQIENLRHSRVSVDPSLAIECICAHTDPAGALEAARHGTMFPGGLASRHIDHYLTGGGADFIEDLRDVLLTDGGVRAKVASAIRRAPRGCVSIEQSDYASHDFKYAFGGIDRMDYQVDRRAGTVHVWFRDRYEWHPEDTGRPSNCVHRAAVELKDIGAADYWMVGDAVVPLAWFSTGPTFWERWFD